MNFAASPGASKGASAQKYPDSKPVEAPPRPTWTGAEPRVAGRSIQMDPAEEELKESKEDQRHAYKDDTALFPGDAKEPIYRVGGYKKKGQMTYKPEDPL